MTAWDNFLSGLVVLFLLPFALMIVSFGLNKVLVLLRPRTAPPICPRPKGVREPIRRSAEPMGLQQAS